MAVAPLHGFLGVLMLETRFPRPPGDIGNAETWRRAGIPVRFAVVRGATPRRVVQDADAALLQPFLDAAVDLFRDGKLPQSGFAAQEQVRLPDFLANRFGCAYEKARQVETIS
jgi:hypothetical protein